MNNMNNETLNKRGGLLDLKAKLDFAEESRLRGDKTFSIEEVRNIFAEKYENTK